MSPRDALIYSGGVGHAFAETSAALAAILGEAGWATRVETDIGAALDALPGLDLFVVNALSWSMTQHEKYAGLRDRWAFSLGDEQIAAIDHAVRGGLRVLVMHTGVICWDAQPLWREIIGGGWQWGVSHHPDFGAFEVELTDAGRALGAGPARFAIQDEAYHALSPADDCTVRATATLVDGAQPIAWTRRHGLGRIAVDALGHDTASIAHPGHRALIDGLLGWLAARREDGVA